MNENDEKMLLAAVAATSRESDAKGQQAYSTGCRTSAYLDSSVMATQKGAATLSGSVLA